MYFIFCEIALSNEKIIVKFSAAAAADVKADVNFSRA
jgi:hypothetical protein